ncbi:MAG: phenylacetate--CoA ligase family protein [Bacteroidetes bacterium]|nr:phenylacetate--CoA ligase family protein [Bacteroidota bacterium]
MNEFVKYYTKNNLLTNRKIREVRQWSKLDRTQLLSKYNEAFLEMFRRAYKYSEFYKNLYREHGIRVSDIKDLTDITKLPTIDRNLIKHDVNKIYNGFDFLKVKGLTSGTSGTPLTVYRTPFNIAAEQGYIRHYRSQFGYTFGQPLLSIRGVLGKAVTHEYFKKANILYISSPNINPGTIEFYHKLIKEFKPVAIEAFPSYLYKIVLELEKKNLQLTIPNAFTSSETLYGFQREKIEPYLGTKIHDWYGNVERTIGIAQDANDVYTPLPLYSINEFQQDKVITTGLINRSFPLIRYAVDDKLIVEGNDLIENILAPKIMRIEGRAGDTVELRDGSVVGCMDHSFKGVPHLETAQIHQYINDKERPLEIKLVTTAGWNNDNEMQLRANLQRMIGDMPVEFKLVTREDLTYSANQKYKLIIKHK